MNVLQTLIPAWTYYMVECCSLKGWIMNIHNIHFRHWHHLDWNAFKSHLGHLSHDPRFWAAVILGALVILMLIVSFIANRGVPSSSPPYHYPMYPYL